MRQLFGIIVVVLLILGIWALVSSAGNQDALRYSDVARNWIETESPTYLFDGSNLLLTGSRKIEDDVYEYTFTFDSRQAGYGDRTDEVSAQVITEHEIVVRVEGMRVVSAITDGVYNEMTGELMSASGNGDNTESHSVQLYFYDEEADTDETGNIMCSADAVVPVTRTIDNYTIERHIQALLDGPSGAEVERGLSSEYPLEGFELESADLSEDGVLTLVMSDEGGATTGGSCRVGILSAQLIKTAESISGVESVVIEPETLFQP